MSSDLVISIALVSLTIVIIGHIFVIARWSGRVDARLEDILRQPGAWSSDLTAMGMAIRAELTTQIGALRAELSIWSDEVKRLRDARHSADGQIQILNGKVQAYDRIMGRLDSFIDHGHGEERK